MAAARNASSSRPVHPLPLLILLLPQLSVFCHLLQHTGRRLSYSSKFHMLPVGSLHRTRRRPSPSPRLSHEA
ncbi:hypothetical protein NEOLEDRAFT_1142389 [Neolentinus lepideus HHB14362 ss-1]|uniref:Secreted protein n=1 Tax=Neolentinus lepideus HHB14362 ss-1 TaxID=1314782 RepID=A0A165N5P6_9AGAM|nr:hypothetical protein NEOLEDRAFT_1142389 [Neolentinus lepideus HHB14362 ss-1]